MTRADKFTAANKIPVYYSDFLDNFDLNPVTQQLAVVTNEQAVVASIKNLVLTNFGERVYHPEIGSKVQSLLFEPGGQITTDLLETTITETISQQEPRATIISLSVTDGSDQNAYWLSLSFSMVNVSKPISVSFPITRVR